MIVLGIESSCDETAVGIVRRDESGQGEILANIVSSQTDQHAPYGGVVPELAARAHISKLDHLIAGALAEAGLSFDDITAIAAVAGPGLIGGVMVGLVMAKAIAFARGLPFLAINHLEAHALSARLTEKVDYPFLLLLISGGHSILVSVCGLGRYRAWGETRDDALGEAFDKTARLLGFDWPGGAALERAAKRGNPEAYQLPRPFFGAAHADFSFAGLKTAVRRIVEADGFVDDGRDISDMAASFQAAAADCLADRTARALARHCDLAEAEAAEITIIAAGGVAANQAIRQRLTELAAAHGARFIAPPPFLCTDNGAMVAWAGAEHFAAGRRDSLLAAPHMRWRLGDK